MRMLLVLFVLELCILHGSADSSLSPSPATSSAVSSVEGVPGLAHHLEAPENIPQSAPPLSDGIVSNSPIVSPPYKSAPVPQPSVIVPLMPSNPPVLVPSPKSAPSNQTVPEFVPPTPHFVSQKTAPELQPPSAVPDIRVPVASPPMKVPEIPAEPHPPEPGVAPNVSDSSNHTVRVASPPIKVPEIAPPVHQSEPGVSPTVSDVVPPKSVPPPGTRKEFGIPVAAPLKETSNQLPPANHRQAKGNVLSPAASPPKIISEKPVAVHPSKPGAAPSASSEHATSPISTPPPSTGKKDYAIPVAAPPKGTFDLLAPVSPPPIIEPSVSPKPTPPPSTSRKEYRVPIAPPPKGKSNQLSPTNQSPTKDDPAEHVMSPKSTPDRSIKRKGYGMPVAAPSKHTFDKLSPMTHSPTKGLSPTVALSPPKVSKPSEIVPTPSIISPKHKKWAPSPASVAPVPFSKHHHARNKVVTPALAPSYSDVPPSSNHRDPVVPAIPHPPTVAPKTSPFIPLAPLHPPTVAPKKSRLKHHYPPPFSHGSVSPVQPPIPSIATQDAPSPSPSPAVSSARTKGPFRRFPLKSPLVSPPRSPNTVLPPPVHLLPPPPPNQDCTSLTCSEPFTNSPPGAPCGCVIPIKVGLRLGVALYTFFPLVSELAQEIASGVFMKQSQVRIMGANAATEQLEKTDVLIDLVPLGENFDNTTAFLTFEKFWGKQVVIKTNFFGAYDVLYVNYPGLPPSPPSAASGIIIDGYNNPGNNARTIHPLGVDVRRRHEGGLSGSIIAIIVLSSFAALALCIGAAWFFLVKCGDPTPLASKTPRASVPSLTRQSGGSTMFGSGVSSASLSFGSSITAYTGTAKTFSADEIEKATDKFNDSRILGEGGFGRVYKGILEDGSEVAVKVLKRDDQQGGREFLAEVEMLSRLHHRNLVKLIGICIEDHSRCLVYELIHNGSVESHLHGIDKETAPLDWGSRMKIALGAARGLAYLHEDSSPHVIHRDFKSSNILLELDFTPKVADFGLARTALDEGNKHISTRVMGTFGYVAPEYAMTGHLLVKSDVYSYGVVLLELLTGRKPVDMSQPEGQENLVAWARPLLTSTEGLEIIIDPALGTDFPFDSIAKVAAIASMCVQPEVSHRPFMGEVVQALKLVCNECEETKQAGGSGSESCSQDYTSVVDIGTRTSTGSGHLVGTSHVHSDYDSSPDVNGGGLSASEIFGRSRRYGRQSPGSFRRYSSSGPLRTGRSRQFWQRVRGLSRGSVSEHGFAYRLWRESR